MMDTIDRMAHGLTAWDVMNRNVVVVAQSMLVREAVRLLDQHRANAAAVVDDQGRCVGLLSPAGVFRWVEAGCPETPVGRGCRCPYQVHGRLLNGRVAMICVLPDGNCPFQAEQPTTGGRHTEICRRKETEHPPFGLVPPYMTTEVVTVSPQTPLAELAHKLSDPGADHLVVLDELDRPVGIVSATELVQGAVQLLTDGFIEDRARPARTELRRIEEVTK